MIAFSQNDLSEYMKVGTVFAGSYKVLVSWYLYSNFVLGEAVAQGEF